MRTTKTRWQLLHNDNRIDITTLKNHFAEWLNNVNTTIHPFPNRHTPTECRHTLMVHGGYLCLVQTNFPQNSLQWVSDHIEVNCVCLSDHNWFTLVGGDGITTRAHTHANTNKISHFSTFTIYGSRRVPLWWASSACIIYSPWITLWSVCKRSRIHAAVVQQSQTHLSLSPLTYLLALCNT